MFYSFRRAALSTTFPIVSVGRRKTAVAQIYIQSGTGKILINGQPIHRSVSEDSLLLSTIQDPFVILKQNTEFDSTKFDVVVKVKGGGVVGQTQAIRLGIARACCAIDKGWRPFLKKEGFLTRDARAKERRKYGLKKARKAQQYSKR